MTIYISVIVNQMVEYFQGHPPSISCSMNGIQNINLSNLDLINLDLDLSYIISISRILSICTIPDKIAPPSNSLSPPPLQDYWLFPFASEESLCPLSPLSVIVPKCPITSLCVSQCSCAVSWQWYQYIPHPTHLSHHIPVPNDSTSMSLLIFHSDIHYH